MCGSCLPQALSSFVGEAAPPTQQGATLHLVPYGGLAPSATPLLRNAAPLNMAIRYISPAKRLTALQVQRTRSALSGSMWLITAHIVPVVRRRAYFWCRQQGLNLQAPGYEPGVLPLNYSDTMAGISASERTIFRAAHMQDAGSVPQDV